MLARQSLKIAPFSPNGRKPKTMPSSVHSMRPKQCGPPARVKGIEPGRTTCVSLSRPADTASLDLLQPPDTAAKAWGESCAFLLPLSSSPQSLSRFLRNRAEPPITNPHQIVDNATPETFAETRARTRRPKCQDRSGKATTPALCSWTATSLTTSASRSAKSRQANVSLPSMLGARRQRNGSFPARNL